MNSFVKDFKKVWVFTVMLGSLLFVFVGAVLNLVILWGGG